MKNDFYLNKGKTAMNKLLLPVVLAGISNLSYATDINCRGLVNNVMDYPGKCDGNTPFMTYKGSAGSKGSGGKWICPPSDKGNAIALTAFAAKKEIGVYIYDQHNGETITCDTLPHYIQSRYIYIIE
ncbi:MAG: hypothetical protein JKY54_04745 [Flavobacteriales bacterium]|nr:hypothetical protein [Flavobacteriales bacterium]